MARFVRWRIGATLLAAAACAVSLAAARPARAVLLQRSSTCSGSAERPFSRWGDLASYQLVPTGSFEGGAGGWTLSGGAKVVSGNETFYVHSRSDSRSLALPAGAAATTPPFCVGLLRPTLRFFAVNGGSTSSTLRVQVVFRGLLGVLGILDGGTVSACSAWQPSPVMLATLNAPLGTTSAQFVFRPADSAGAWRIDDVYVDPWLNR